MLKANNSQTVNLRLYNCPQPEIPGMAASDSTPSLPQPREDLLAQRIREGDRAAEAELAQRFTRPVFLICLARLRDRDSADDLTQEILLAVLRALRAGHLREPDKLPQFVQGTARNLINNFIRTRIRRAESTLPEAEALPFDATAEFRRVERRQALSQALQELSHSDREILELAAIEGLSSLEIAQRLGVSHDAIRARKSRAIRKIAEKLHPVSHIPTVKPHS